MAEELKETLQTRLTIYYNTPLTEGNNFKIDNLNLFLERYPNDLKKTFNWGRYVRVENLKLRYSVPEGAENLDVLSKANYAQIELRRVKYLNGRIQESETQDLPRKYYYFINDLTVETINSIAFDLTLDVLNFVNEGSDFIFSNNTLVMREHISRFKNVNPVLKNGRYYFLRNIVKNSFNENMVDRIREPLFCDSDLRRTNYWVKVLITSKSGFFTCYMPFYRDIVIRDENYNTHTIYSYYTYTTKKNQGGNRFYSEILDGAPQTQLSLNGYPPGHIFDHRQLENYYQLPPIFQFYEFTINDGEEVFKFNLIKTEFDDYLEQSREEDNFDYNGRIVFGTGRIPEYNLNNILKNLLTCSISEEDFNKLKNGENFVNGIFSGDKFYEVNESGLLTSGLISIVLDYNNAKFNILLEDFKYNEQELFDDFINEIVDDGVDGGTILTATYQNLYGPTLGAGFVFLGTKYFKNKNFANKFIKLENLVLPKTTEDYFNKLKEGQIVTTKFDDEIKIAQKNAEYIKRRYGDSLIGKGVSALNLISGYISATIKDPSEGFRRLAGNAMPLARGVLSIASGHFILGGVRLASSLLNKKQEENEQLASQTPTTLDTVFLLNKELKAFIHIKQVENINFYQTQFYLNGDEVNEYKQPLHNNRRHFDYLQCHAVFSKFILSNKIREALIQKYNEGVYYIHNNNNRWRFPFDNVENIEKWIFSDNLKDYFNV